MTSLDSWHRSIICLSYQINQLSHTNNLLSASATERNEFFFADIGVPLPRPCTAWAWASLCSFGPHHGVIQDATGSNRYNEPRRGRFLVPFLPKIRYGEDTTQSLIRTSKAHIRDSSGNIRWGSVFVGESNTGLIVEQLSHGAIDSKLWMHGDNHSPIRDVELGLDSIPALYSYLGEGWLFGVIQDIPGMQLTLRDPMIELARNGIPELGRISHVPKVKRLLIRFLDINAVRKWGIHYAEALEAAYDSDLVEQDAKALAQEIKEAENRRFKEAVKDAGFGRSKAEKPKINSESLAGLINGIDL